MATAVADPPKEESLPVEAADGSGEASVSDISFSREAGEVKNSNEFNGTSSSSFITAPPGPPILHPTVTTWQWLFSASDMQHTPTVIHSGTSPEQERYWRWKGAQLIFRIGDYMRLGNHVMTTAAIFFHRFYMRRSLPKDVRERPHDTFTFQEIAPTCIFLACKVEETHRKLHGVVEATMAVMDRTPLGLDMAEARTYKADVNSKDYRRWKDTVLLYEERLLETLCFDLIIEQPHPIAIKACKRLGTSRDMAQLTVILLNTILYGAVCTFYDAAVLASAAFQKACSLVEIDPASYLAQSSSSRRWYDAFDVDVEEVEDAMPDIEQHLTFHNDVLNGQQGSKANKANGSTPNVHQHTSLLAQQGEAPPSIPPHSDAQAKHLHFANQETVIEVTGDAASDQHPAAPVEAMEVQHEGEEDAWAVQREERTDPSRPISRHGSKGSNRGPPPPLASAASAASEGADDLADDPHEEAAAAKVHQEQLQQEEATVTSEEEGAL